MATLDKQRDLVVVRIVYDGPPISGKTTSVRALAEGLGRKSETPDEVNGRTLFFDWVDYVGGMFEGHRIRCQIVTVPGQETLAERRRYLLSTADSVVFVADTTRQGWHQSRLSLENCIAGLTSTPHAPVGVVLQANKRDAEDAIPKDVLQEELQGHSSLGIVESVATTGRGVREAFVFGVRLALDRVRELIRTSCLEEGRPEVDAPDELLAAVRAREAQVREVSEGAQSTPRLSATETTTPSSSGNLRLSRRFPETATTLAALELGAEPSQEVGVPSLPSPRVPSGRIWPPVDGRALLHALDDITSGRTPLRTPSGDYLLVLPGAHWLVHSHAAAEFDDPRVGEVELLSWARVHAMSRHRLSEGRCIVLAESSPGRYRLWQIVKQHPSVEELVTASFISGNAELVATALLEGAVLLTSAYPYFDEEPCRLPCSASTVGQAGWKPAYLGLVPQPRFVEPASARPLDPKFASRELRSLVNRVGALERLSPDAVLHALRRVVSDRPQHLLAAEAVKSAFAS
jgi:signal recognition particle receptor subunit beta